MFTFNGRTHAITGVILWVVLACCGLALHPLYFIGILFPDADKRKTALGRFIPLWLIFKHRGFTHTLLGVAVFSAPILALFGFRAAFGFAVGCLLHLLMDSLTPMGVKWGGRRS